MEVMPTQDPRNRRLGERSLASNLETRQTQPAQSQDDGHFRWRGLPWERDAGGTNAPQVLSALDSITCHPFADGPLRDARLARGHFSLALLGKDRFHDARSTVRSQPSIVMQFHVGWI